jgi:hypothetical protein
MGLCRLKSSALRDDGLSEFSQRKPASLIALVTVNVIVHLEIERSFVKSRHGRHRTIG